MEKYYVELKKSRSGEHLIHTKECDECPSAIDRTFLGEYETYSEAKKEAKHIYEKVNACRLCLRDYHK
jgi:hypothetical protein